MQGLRHNEAIVIFKSIKTGDVHIMIGRRINRQRKNTDAATPPPLPAAATVNANDNDSGSTNKNGYK